MDQKKQPFDVERLPDKDMGHGPSCQRNGLKNATTSSASLTHLSLEILVKILSSLTLREILLLESTSKKLSMAITIHLRTRKSVDFTEGKWYGEMSPLMTDGIFSRLLLRCPEVNSVFGIHPRSITKRQQRHADTLSVDGITAALTFCNKLKSISTSNIQVLDAMLAINPNLEIVGGFRNRGGDFPISPQSRLTIPSRVRLSQLILTGVSVPSLPPIESLSFLQLRWVKFTDPEPFRDFSCPKLEHFVMKNCMGDVEIGSFSPLACIPLFHALGKAVHLERLELVRVPFPGGVFRHVVEDNWRVGSFRYLTRISLVSCYDALEVDLGYLVLVSAFRLEELLIQPSLTKDAVFSALLMAHAEYPRFESLHLGYADDFPEKGQYTEEELLQHGLMIEREQTPALSDRGMKLALQVFPQVRYLSAYNCPNLRNAALWLTPNLTCMALCDLTLQECNNLSLEHFSEFFRQLPAIEYLRVEDMFKKGSSNELSDTEEDISNKDGKLVLTSQVIKSVSLQECGIIKLSIINCPRLSSISCTKCKELSQVEFQNCLLNRANFSWCPALRMKSLLDEFYN
ncbi:F-box only protein 38-like, partial [Oculina patagonica]